MVKPIKADTQPTYKYVHPYVPKAPIIENVAPPSFEQHQYQLQSLPVPQQVMKQQIYVRQPQKSKLN